MQVARQPPKSDYTDLESRVRELVDKEERIRPKSRLRRLRLWVFLLTAALAASLCREYVLTPKMFTRVKTIMIRASQISWKGDAAPLPQADFVAVGHLNSQIAEMSGELANLRQRYEELGKQNETLARELAEMVEDTAKKIRELENAVEIIGKKPPKPRKLVLTDPESPKAYHAPTQASQAKNEKQTYVLGPDGMTRLQDL